MTTLLLAGIHASGGASLETIISTPPDIYGDAPKSRPIAWYRNAADELCAGYVDKLEALGERAALGRLESADLGLRGVGRPQTDLVGRVYGGWTVVSKYRDGAGYKGSRWTIKHACGYETTRIGQKLAHSEPTRCQNCGKR